MTENEARYIVRMIRARQHNMLFADATTEDDAEQQRIKERYISAGRWERGTETSLAEFVMRVANNGVPGGEYLIGDIDMVKFRMNQRELPLIKRPKKDNE